MGSIDRYIFRTTLASFALILVSLTGVIWITQALRGIDLMTSQGQTIVTFLGITSLVIPALVLVIAPIALMIAISHTLNKLATDSEIIVMNAAGFSPFRLFRPFFFATCVVAAIVAFIGAYLAPDTLERAWAMGIKPKERLADNDGHGLFGALGDSVITGPTLTNANDFRAVLIGPQASRK